MGALVIRVNGITYLVHLFDLLLHAVLLAIVEYLLLVKVTLE